MSKKTDPTLKKCDELIDKLQNLKKALITSAPSNRTPTPALGVGWSQHPTTGAFHHSTHGVISTTKHPEGYYQVSHGGRQVGRAATPAEAGAKIKSYVKTLMPHDAGTHNVDPMKVGKNEDMDKSGYGPKGASQYNLADNARRKSTNTGDSVDVGANRNVKNYSTHAGQLSAKQQAAKTPYKGAAGPVKTYSQAEIAAINEARKLKKNAEGTPWMNHGSVPNADVEVQKLKVTNPVSTGEDAAALQLANLMSSKSMMAQRPPTTEEMIKAGERMFGERNEETLAKQDQQWNGAISNWLLEAQKPITARFSSEEEELAYWSNLKVRDDGKP